jgi:hypothetical protein
MYFKIQYQFLCGVKNYEYTTCAKHWCNIWETWFCRNVWLHWLIIFIWLDRPTGPGPPHYLGSEITPRSTTFGNTLTDEWPSRRGDLYLTQHTHTHKRSQKRDVHASGCVRTHNPASERPQTHALDRAATGIGINGDYVAKSTARFCRYCLNRRTVL